MTRRKSIFVGLGIVGFAILLIVIMMASRPTPPKKPVNNTAPLVEAIVPTRESVAFEIKAHGVVNPRTETTLVSEVSGVVEKVSEQFLAGGYFSQGDILLQIDPTEYEVGVEQAKARLASQEAKYLQELARAEQAEKEWELTGRSKENAPILALRKPFLLEAKANKQSAEADLKKALQKLERTVIRAPYTGMVKQKIVDIGQFVSMGSQLGVTFAIDYAEIRLPLTAQDLAFIDIPDWADDQDYPLVDLSASYAGTRHVWKGQLVRMEGVVDQQSRTHYAVVRIKDPYGLVIQNEAKENKGLPPLKIGSFVTANIQGKVAEDVIKLPRDVFKDLVRVLVIDKNSKLFYRSLNILRAENKVVYVKGGLETGDRVIKTSIQSPIEGMALRVAGDKSEQRTELNDG